jgi:flagellar biosynthesis GTPase FlhF
MVEVEVAEAPLNEGPGDPFSDSYREASASPAPEPGEDDLRPRLHRMEALAERVRGVTDSLERYGAGSPDYPLRRQLAATGCSVETLDELAEAFATANRGGENSYSAARRHLAKYLRATSALRFSQVEGEHWFLGRAGVGKTSLALQLAAEMRRAERSVAMIALAPRHDGELRRLEMASKALGMPAMVAYDAAELDAARMEFDHYDVVLVDTPCHLSHRLSVTIPDAAHRHLVVPLAESRMVLREQLRDAVELEVDTFALTQMDLFPRPGRSVDLAVELRRPVSFLQGFQDGALRLRLARGESLLQAALGESDPGAGSAPSPELSQRQAAAQA